MFQASQVTMILGKPRIYVNGGSEIAQKGRGAWRSHVMCVNIYGSGIHKFLDP